MVQKEQADIKHIIRVANVDIVGKKEVRIALTKIKGVGNSFADIICRVAGVSQRKKAGLLSNEEATLLGDIITDPKKHNIPEWVLNRRKDSATGENKHLITGSLIFEQDNDLKRLKKIKCYRGVRHQKRLTVRGQRTRSNFRSSKGKVVGVKKKK